MDEFEDFPEDETHKQVVAGPVFVCSLLDKNAKKVPLLKMHGVLYANGMLLISEEPGSRSLKTVDMEEAKITPFDSFLKDFQRRQFKHKPFVCLIDLIHPDYRGKFPTLPGLGLVLASENQMWLGALGEAAGAFEQSDRRRSKAKRWMRRLWRGLSGGLVDKVESEDAASYASVDDPSLNEAKKGFRSFREYLSASVHDRHSQPPTHAEFDSVVQFVREVSETSHDWSPCTDQEEVFALKSLDLDTGVIRVKTTAALQGIPAEVAFRCIYDAQTRESWDKHFRFFQTQPTPKGCNTEGRMDVIFACVKSPFGVADREFVEWRLCRKAGDDYQIYLRSCDWEEAPLVARGRVRADVIASVYVITPLPHGNAELVVYSQVDIKGYIPKAIINSLAPSAPLRWIRKLRSACQDFMNHHSACPDRQ